VTVRDLRVAVVGALLAGAVLLPRDAAAQAERAAVPAGAGRAVPLALRRYHHTVWPLGEVAPLGSQASVLRSPDGYLWLDSRAGIARFDGVRFSVLTSRHSAVLASGRATGRDFQVRVVDRSGQMWIARHDGALLTYERGAFRVVMSAPPAGVRRLGPYRDGVGRLWVVVDSSGDQWAARLVHGRLLRGAWPAGAPRTGIRAIVPDTHDGMWVGTQADGVWHVTPRGIRRYQIPTGLAGRSGDRNALPLLQSRDGALWVSTAASGGVMRMRGGVWSPVRLPGGARPVVGVSVVEAPDGTVFIGDRGAGVLRWSAGRVEPLLPGGRGGQVVHDLLLDDEGSLWASTDAGLERFRRTPFAHVVRADGSPTAPTYELAADAGGTLWLSDRIDRALYRIDGVDARRSTERMSMTAVPLPSTATAAGFQILRGAERGVWIAPRQGGLMLVAPDGTTAFGRESGLPAERIWRGDVDATGALWLNAVPHGAGRFHGGRYSPLSIPGDGREPDGAFRADDTRQRVVFADEKRPAAYAVDSAGSLRRLDRDSPLTHVLEHAAVEGRDTVWGVLDDLPGLARIANERASAVRFGAPLDPLPGFNAQLVVSGGWLWFASGSGVGRFSLAPLHRAADRGTPAPAPQLFNSLDGIPMPRLADYGAERMVLAPDGRIWMSTPAGLVVADPGDIPSNRVAPAVHVEEVVVDGRMLVGAERTGTDARVAANPGRVDLHFTALGLRLPERLRLEYRLDGVDPGWQPSRGPRVATYTQLRPGRYRFRVRAWNEDGVPSAGEATLALQVLPAWHQTWWASAFGLVAVGGAGAAGAGAVARPRRRRADAAALATVAERARVARELHDTILGDLAGMAMQLEAVASRARSARRPPAGPGRRRPRRAAGRRRAARPGAPRARRGAPRGHRHAADVGRRRAALGAARRDRAAGVRRDRRDGPRRAHRPRAPLRARRRGELLRIATEALLNARKHAACRTVTVTCAVGRDGLRVAVRDDGRGFAPDRAAPTGTGGSSACASARRRRRHARRRECPGARHHRAPRRARRRARPR
jgi:ligand-binding sensor domain-containing protein